MNRGIVLAEWRRASEALRAAELLAAEGCYADAVSRAYYAILHAAKAALLANDIEAGSHAAVRRLFGLHLVRGGGLETAWAAALAESSDDRLVADYDVEALFCRQDAERQCSQAGEFRERIRGHLLGKGLTESELAVPTRG